MAIKRRKRRFAEEANCMAKKNDKRLYKTDATLKRTLRVSYPAGEGRLQLMKARLRPSVKIFIAASVLPEV